MSIRHDAKKLGLSVAHLADGEWIIYQRSSSWADGPFEKDMGMVDGCETEAEALDAAIAYIRESGV